MVLQPINLDEIVIFGTNGGNSLGINPEDGPLISASSFPFPLRVLLLTKFVSSIQHRVLLVAANGWWNRQHRRKTDYGSRYCSGERDGLVPSIYLPELCWYQSRRLRWVWGGKSGKTQIDPEEVWSRWSVLAVTARVFQGITVPISLLSLSDNRTFWKA